MNSFDCNPGSDRRVASCTHRCRTAASCGLLNLVETMFAPCGSSAFTAANKRFFDGAVRRAGESMNACSKVSTFLSLLEVRTDIVRRLKPRFLSRWIASCVSERSGGCAVGFAIEADIVRDEKICLVALTRGLLTRGFNKVCEDSGHNPLRSAPSRSPSGFTRGVVISFI